MICDKQLTVNKMYMKDNYKQFIEKFPLTEKGALLALLTTIKIGGKADLYYKLTKIEEIEGMLKLAKEFKIPVFIFGGGSNIIFSDKGFKGLVIQIKAKEVRVIDSTIVADAGALLSQVLQFAIKNGLSGMENLMGLPGTIGGAVRGNAGAFGTEIKDIFQKALIYNKEKGIHEEEKDYLNFKYRSSTIKEKQGEDIVLKVYLELQKKDTSGAMKEMIDKLTSRSGKQPQGKTTGSFFKNPMGDQSAGALLDQAGCKGLQVGGVEVSTLHANWILNNGSATQKDVIELMRLMQKKVKAKFNIDLEPEVQIIGETGIITT